MAAVGKKGKKEPFIRAKISFTSPYILDWSPLLQEDMHFILNTLKNRLVSTGFAKKEVKVFRPWRKKKVKNPASTSEPTPEVKQDVPVQDSAPEVEQDAPVQDSPKNGWTDVAARKQLAIGINEVTKALERNKLKLLLVCKSVKPRHMADHLITLSVTRGVPACQVPQLSRSLSELLGLKSVLALGFRHCDSKEDELFTDTVEAIMPRVPSLNVPWLQDATQSVKPEDFMDTDDDEEEEREGVSEKRGQKRKLESDSDTTDAATPCALQPLQVKKIVGNPQKKEKKKKRKGKGKS